MAYCYHASSVKLYTVAHCHHTFVYNLEAIHTYMDSSTLSPYGICEVMCAKWYTVRTIYVTGVTRLEKITGV